MSTNEKIYGVEVILENLEAHPTCAHGPTLLFSRKIDKNGTKRNFYACSAYRDRKGCPFFMWADEKKLKTDLNKSKSEENLTLMPKINHEAYYLQLKKIRGTDQSCRSYCHTCNKLLLKDQLSNHVGHNLTNNLLNEVLDKPMSLLKPLNENKKEAQYLFTEETVDVIMNIVSGLGYRNLLCIGAPLIHEHVQNLSYKSDITSLLLDIDARFHSFYSPTQYCWYNSFNHHFFSDRGKKVFLEFLKDGGKRNCLIMDPPFGGRLEPLSQTLSTISSTLQLLNNMEKTKGINLPVILIMPYFMEPLIKAHMLGMSMCDYKVTYRNHSQFKNGKSKQGSIVRLFTNIPLSKIKLPSDEYKFCKLCERWVSKENLHCNICNSCTSKDGRTYVHCNICNRCVKPTWTHCKTCSRCCLPDHPCKGMQKQDTAKNRKSGKQKLGNKNFQNNQSKIVKKGRKKNKHKQKLKAILFNQSKVA